jgi:SAM-dependent methyltransferase
LFAASDRLMIYQSVNQTVLRRIPVGTRTLLDVGCGGGAFGAAVRACMPCSVVGVTHSAAEADVARPLLDHVEVGDLNTFDPAVLGTFDCVVCSHVLEHLLAPDQVLVRLRSCLAPGGCLLVALPNVLYWKQRMQFMRGRFRYTNGGLMDNTHYRFFDWDSSQRLVRDAGYVMDEAAADGGFPLSRLFGEQLGSAIDRCAVSRYPGLFGFQFILRSRSADTRPADAFTGLPSGASSAPSPSTNFGPTSRPAG